MFGWRYTMTTFFLLALRNFIVERGRGKQAMFSPDVQECLDHLDPELPCQARSAQDAEMWFNRAIQLISA
jgi:hypothetical protein